MRNRLNVSWHGKRTTARFPDYLWRLALISSGWSDSDLVTDLRSSLVHHESDSLYRHYTATQFVTEKLVEYIEEELTLAGFNPGNSRAPGHVPSPGLSAAEARPISDEHKRPRGGNPSAS